MCWWGDAPLFAHAQRLFELKRFEGRRALQSSRSHPSDRKELAARLHSNVEHIFEPVVTPDDRAFETGY